MSEYKKKTLVEDAYWQRYFDVLEQLPLGSGKLLAISHLFLSSTFTSVSNLRRLVAFALRTDFGAGFERVSYEDG